MIVTITENGTHTLKDNNNRSNVRFSKNTTVFTQSNPDGATLEYGNTNSLAAFVVYPSGTIADGDVINHGRGARLQVQVTGLTSSVEISVN